MKLLLDTHMFLWYISGDIQLPEHRDPFDRMLICQALEHQLIIATVDRAMHGYPVAIL